MERKIFLDVVPDVDGVPIQPGKVFHYDAVNLPSLHVAQHPLKGFPLKGSASDAAVSIGLNDFKIGAESNVCLHDLPLGEPLPYCPG